MLGRNLIQNQIRKPGSWMLNRKQVRHLTLRLSNVKQVCMGRLLCADLASSLNQIAKFLGKIDVAFACFGSSKLKTNRMKSDIVAFGVTLKKCFELCGACH